MSNIFFKTSSGYVDYIRRDGFTINLVNPAFSEDNFKFWSYPYEDYMTDEFKREFHDYSVLNKGKLKKKEAGQLYIEGKVYDATLEIISSDTNLVRKQIDFGYHKLNFTDFNIQDLNFGEINVPEIYDYVDAILDKTFPEINHCFPRVYNENFVESVNQTDFNKVPLYNDTTNGLVVRISPTVSLSTQNLIKPYVYLLDVVSKGFEKLGYSIDGDILNDRDFRFICLDNEGISYDELKLETLEYNIDYPSKPGEYVSGTKEKSFKFTIFGKHKLEFHYSNNDLGSNPTVWQNFTIEIKFNSTIISVTRNRNNTYTKVDDNGLRAILLLYELDLPFFTKETDVEVKITFTFQYGSGFYPHFWLDTYFLPQKFNGIKPGDTIMKIKTQMTLSDFVPDVTFSEVLDLLKKYGYRIIPVGRTVFINKISNTAKTKDFTFAEVEFPEITSNKNEALIIRLSSYDKLKYGKVTISEDGILINSDKQFGTKEEIIINALPLPIFNYDKKIITYNSSGVATTVVEPIEVVKEVEDSGTNLRLIKYRGVFNKKNDGLSLAHFLPENSYLTFFKEKIKYFHGENIKWSFISDSEEFVNLSENDKIFAYKKELEIINLTKTFIGEKMYQIDFETISIL